MWLYDVSVYGAQRTVCVGRDRRGTVLYVASYLERGHLAWLTDNSPTAQRAAVSQVLMTTTLPWEPGEWVEKKKSEVKKKDKPLFSSVSFASSAFSFIKPLFPTLMWALRPCDVQYNFHPFLLAERLWAGKKAVCNAQFYSVTEKDNCQK